MLIVQKNSYSFFWPRYRIRWYPYSNPINATDQFDTEIIYLEY